MFEDVGHGPTVRTGPPLTMHRRDGVHCRTQRRVILIEMLEKFLRGRKHPAKIADKELHDHETEEHYLSLVRQRR